MDRYSCCVLGGQEKTLDCHEAELSSADFTGAQLGNLNLQRANLSGAILNGAMLDKSQFDSANLNGVVALRARFVGAVLTDATAQMGIFTQATFDNAVMTRVRMGASSFLFDLDAEFAAELDQNRFPQPDLLEAFESNGVTLQPTAAIEIVVTGKHWLIDDSSGPYKLLLTDEAIQVFNNNPGLIPAILQSASCMGVVASTASLSGADLRGVRWYAAPATLDHADLQDAVFSSALLVLCPVDT